MNSGVASRKGQSCKCVFGLGGVVSGGAMVSKGGRWHVGAMKSRHSLGKRREVGGGASQCPALTGIRGIGEQGQRRQSSHLAKTGRPVPVVAENLAIIKNGG